MSEWKHDILVENIRALLKRHDMTQQQLAEITGMTQANVSRALNPNDKRHFTLEQVICISQHFGVPIDELVGNKVPQDAATSPRAVLALDAYMRKYQINKRTNFYQTNNILGYVEYSCVNEDISSIYADFLQYLTDVKVLRNNYLMNGSPD